MASVNLSNRLRLVEFTELTGGNGCSLLAATPGPDLAAAGYTEAEYAVLGSVPGRTVDGVLDAADFVTRILVRRPVEAADFNGTLVVEWLNVSSGNDAAPEYTYLAPELVRGGYAWVGVSAQYIGIEGGSGSVGMSDPAVGGLAARDPERYGALRHPGDAYCYDIFGMIGAALQPPTGASDSDHPLAGLPVRHTLAAGESQSAFALTTYVNDVAEEHGVFDGFLIHSRAAAGLPYGIPGAGIPVDATFRQPPRLLRRDLSTPVMTLQTETDLLTNFGFYRSRQPDDDRLRTWEMAGTSHADLFQIGPYEDLLGCADPVNRGQQRFVLRAALRHLHGWVSGGDGPPIARPLLLDAAGDPPRLALDRFGNARDGVRTPCVDAPTQRLSGIVENPVSRICLLFGSTHAIDPGLLRAYYDDRDSYLTHYRSAIDAAVDAGFVLDEDRAELVDDARPDLLDG